MRVKLRLRPLSNNPSDPTVPPLPEAVPETVHELKNAEPVWGVAVAEVPHVPCKTESFEIVNWVAAGGHLFNAVLTLVIGDDKQYRIYDTYASWTPYNSTAPCPPNQYIMEGSEGTFLVNPRDKVSMMSLSLLWLIFAFHILSALFQGYTGFSRDYVTNIKQRGVNPLRFVEYSLSATIMLVCIALVSGIDEFYAMLAVASLTFVTMMLGLIAELLFDDQLVDRLTTRRIGWIAHLTGWVTMLSAYVGVILKQYFVSVRESDVGPPDWVTVAIFVVFGLYNIFGVTQFVQLWYKYPLHLFFKPECVPDPKDPKDPKKVCGMELNVLIEMVYVANSLVTKTLLGWMIIINLVVEDTRNFC
jgi:hypothetical protein